MAVQYNNFCGFETQGYEELASVQGTPGFDATTPLMGNASVTLASNGTLADVPWVSTGVTDQGNKHYVSARFRIPSTPSITAQGVFFSVRDDSGVSLIRVECTTGGTLILKDANGGTLDTSAGTYNDGAAHTLEIYGDFNSDSAAWEWWLDGTSEGSGTGADLHFGTNTFGSSASLVKVQGLASGGGLDITWDDVVCMSGLTATSDRPSSVPEVFGYQPRTTTGVVPNAGLTSVGTSGGDNLNFNSWNWAATPWGGTAHADYTASGAAGAGDTDASGRAGPNGDSNIDGTSNIKAIKGVWILWRGNGAGTTHYIGMGDSTDTNVADQTVTLNTTAAPGENFEWFRTTNLPTSTEYMTVGFGTNGARDIACGDVWGMVLHVPAASGTTISMALASFTLSGQTVTITRNVPFTANAGSFTLTGQTLDFTFSTAIAMALATFSLSGQDPTITRQLLFNADAGTVTFTGRTADLLRALVLNAAQGSFTLSGLDPTLSRNVPFLSDTGSFTLSGLDVDLLRALLVNMDTGMATLTGQELTLLVTTPVLMALASFALSGLDVGITRQIVVDMALGAMAFTGRDNTITRQIPVAMDAGGFTLGGQDATFTLSVVVNMDAGGFTLSGQDLTFIRDLIVAMATGSATVSGLDANLLRAIPVNMDLGAFTLAGQDPTLLRQIPVTMDLGSYTFNGQTVTINVSGEINMELGTFTLSGMSADFITAGGSGGTPLIPIIRRRRR